MYSLYDSAKAAAKKIKKKTFGRTPTGNVRHDLHKSLKRGNCGTDCVKILEDYCAKDGNHDKEKCKDFRDAKERGDVSLGEADKTNVKETYEIAEAIKKQKKEDREKFVADTFNKVRGLMPGKSEDDDSDDDDYDEGGKPKNRKFKNRKSKKKSKKHKKKTQKRKH